MEAVLTKRQSKKGLRDSEKVHNFIVWCLIFFIGFHTSKHCEVSYFDNAFANYALKLNLTSKDSSFYFSRMLMIWSKVNAVLVLTGLFLSSRLTKHNIVSAHLRKRLSSSAVTFGSKDLVLILLFFQSQVFPSIEWSMHAL